MHPPAIVLTAFGNLETAISLVHDLGAFWFLEKPLQPGALPAAAGARRGPAANSRSTTRRWKRKTE